MEELMENKNNKYNKDNKEGSIGNNKEEVAAEHNEEKKYKTEA